MRLSLVLAILLWIALFVAGQVYAAPSADFCLENPTSPLCGGGIFEDPPLADPGDPEPDVDPCVIDPASCEPETEDPAVTGVRLAGRGRLAARGLRLPIEPSFTLSHDGSTFTLHDGCEARTGSMVAKGRSGRKHKLFLDAASLESLSGLIAEHVSFLAGHGGAALGAAQKLVLKEQADGRLKLSIKLEIAVEGLGEVVYKVKAATSTVPAYGGEGSRVLCR